MTALTRDEVLRYSRHLVMPEVTLEGQVKLKEARVLCVGAGGLGSPLTLYLAAAGVGTIGVVDFDTVDLTNIQRQILYATADVGRTKLDAAGERLRLNPEIGIVPHRCIDERQRHRPFAITTSSRTDDIFPADASSTTPRSPEGERLRDIFRFDGWSAFPTRAGSMVSLLSRAAAAGSVRVRRRRSARRPPGDRGSL
jgi:hypothetical protein